MSRAIDETRRDFLLRLAKTAAFVPPAIASFDVTAAAAQGKGSAQSSSTSSSAVVGSMSPTANTMTGSNFQMTPDTAGAPWTPSRPSQPPPWSRPPPTQTGR